MFVLKAVVWRGSTSCFRISDRPANILVQMGMGATIFLQHLYKSWKYIAKDSDWYRFETVHASNRWKLMENKVG
jgi:hypothetical protein